VKTLLKSIKLGSRGSQLALWQSECVKKALIKAYPDLSIEIKVIKTTGDKILDVALSKIGDKGLFTKEIEKEMLAGKIDMAVHSMKDLPSQIESGLCIGAVLKRENPQDVLIANGDFKLMDLPFQALVGTSSLRRKAQIKAVRPDLQIVDLRGNVETRIKKLRQGNMDAIILACAGVKRLGYEQEISQYLPYELMLPAPGQGAIAVQARENDSEILSLLTAINDIDTATAVAAERSFLAKLEGGCQVPIAARAEIKAQQLTLQGMVASLDGSTILRLEMQGDRENPVGTGLELGQRMLACGAKDILNQVRQLGE
jgi:hydroxymethylbilane synthase